MARGRQVCPQAGVHSSSFQAERVDRKHVQHVLYERFTLCPSPRIGAMDTVQQLGRRDGGYRHLLVVTECQRRPTTFETDQDGAVEERAHGSWGSGPSCCLNSCISLAKSASGEGPAPSSASASFHVIRRWACSVGPIRATGRPCRSTSKVSPRCSTSFNTSRKRLAAVVALIVLATRA